MLYRIRRLLPFWMVVTAFAAGHSPVFWVLALVGASLLSLIVPRPKKLSTFGELVTCLVVLVAPIMWSKSQEDLNPAISFSLTVLCTFVTRSFLQDPLLGAAVDRLLILAAAVAIGLGLKSPAYPLLMALCSFTLFGRFKPEATKRPVERSTWFALGLAALCLGAMLLFIPWLNNATNRRFSHYLQGRSSQTGFSPSVRLDGEGGIETSNAIALRIYARGGANIETIDYLRGSTLDRFDGSSWSASTASVRDGETTQDGRTEVSVTAFADVQSTQRAPYVFAPLGRSVWSAHRVSVDGFGVWRAGGLGIDHWALLDKGDGTNGLSPHAPRDADLEVPAALIPQLHALALSWTDGATTDDERIARITAKLRQFEYTLDRGKDAKWKRNPLLDFLLVSQRGHCEFFATALVTLGRTLGIPGRMVTGYRVVERNGYGHYAVVRARHAHAWAEVYLDGQWKTIDATPAVLSLTPMESRSARALLDYLSIQVQRAYDSAMDRPERTLPALAGVVLVGLLVRRWLLRRRKEDQGAYGEQAPQGFVDFSANLAALGFTRAPSETLSMFAERLRAADHVAYAEQLLRYAEARYNPKQPEDAWQLALRETTTK